MSSTKFKGVASPDSHRLDKSGLHTPTGGDGLPSGFFTLLPMAREFWAEDPDWTANPGDGNVLTTLRDAGTLGIDMGTPNDGTGSGVFGADELDATYGAYVFTNNGSTAQGGYGNVATGDVSTPFTVGAVFEFRDIQAAEFGNVTDSNDASERMIFGYNDSGAWRFHHSAALTGSGGTADTSLHLGFLVIEDNATQLLIDGSVVASDVSGTADANVTGMNIASNNLGTTNHPNIDIGYVFQIAGDIRDQANYALWLSRLNTHYGL